MTNENPKTQNRDLEKMLLGSRTGHRSSEHAMEVVAEHGSITWVNHSIATTVDGTWDALRDTPGKIVLIIGGVDRGTNYAPLVDLVSEKVTRIVCLGSTRERYFQAFQRYTDMIVHATDLQEAVQVAAFAVRPGQTVLFAPACPSYHAFDNYKNRGNAFRRLVQELISKQQ